MREQYLLRDPDELVRDRGGADALSQGDCGGCGGDCGCLWADCCGGCFCAEVCEEEEEFGGRSFLSELIRDVGWEGWVLVWVLVLGGVDMVRCWAESWGACWII